METAKVIEIVARVSERNDQENGITFLVGGSGLQGSSPLIFNFFNSNGDLPFKHFSRGPEPDTDQWTAGTPYLAANTDLPLDTFYDNGKGFLILSIGQNGTPVYIEGVWVVDPSGTKLVAFEFYTEITSDGVTAMAENRQLDARR